MRILLMTGAPIAKFHLEDSKDPNKDKSINDFSYKDQICPISAHIRKTNIREVLGPNDSDPRAKRTKILRRGITYGDDYQPNETANHSARGLLFVCYQGAIEDGFENMQASWSNSTTFRKGTPGHDPIIGQTQSKKLTTRITDKDGKVVSSDLEFAQLVTLKGGEYFFAPSISALRGDLSKMAEKPEQK